MPYKIQGRILAIDGSPLYTSAVRIEELSPVPFVNVWGVDADTGQFTFNASSENALIKVSSKFYKPKVMVAKFLQGDTMLEDDGVVMEGKTTKSNAVWWLLGIFGAIAALSVASGNAAKKADAKTAAKAKPAAKPKEVEV